MLTVAYAVCYFAIAVIVGCMGAITYIIKD